MNNNLGAEKPLISIIVPAFNEEKYLSTCLESLLNQKGDIPYEIIVVDNNSTDLTSQIALSKGVRLVQEPIQGLTKARQTGFEASKGEILAYIDADSIAPNDWIVCIQKAFSESPKAIALRGLYRYVLASPIHRAIFWIYFNFVERLASLILKDQIISGMAFVVRKSALQKIGGFNLNIKFYGEDMELASRLKKIGLIYRLNSIVLSSGRRFDEKGILIPGFIYLFNYLWLLVFKKPVFNFYNTPEKNLDHRENVTSTENRA